MSATIGYFETEDRDAVICVECEPSEGSESNAIIDDAITADWDGADQFRCAHCGRLLVDVVQVEA